MAGHCCGSTIEFDGTSPAYRRALWAVILINAVMFVVEMSAGHAAHSKSLQVDALDFLGDSLTYALSLFIIGKPLKWRSRVAMIKSASLFALALWIFATTVWAFFNPVQPNAPIISGVGIAALIANLVSVGLLMRFKNGDANVRSVWLCSRNDAINNVAVIFAGVGVWLSGSHLPDLLVATAMGGLFLKGSIEIFTQARQEMQREKQGLSHDHHHDHEHARHSAAE